MAEVSIETKLSDALARVTELEAKLADSENTVKLLAKQIDGLKQAASYGRDLPDEVKKDAEFRMSHGIPRDIAVELAVKQHQHNKNLKANADKSSAKK